MMKMNRAVGFRTSCATWEGLLILAKMGNTTVGKTINKMLDIYIPQLLNKIEPERLEELKEQILREK